MQKSPFSQIMREEVTRALVFGISFFVILSTGFVSVAYAANGGEFGRILNMILASGNWETDTSGKVKDSDKLGGKNSSDFVPLATSSADRSCGGGKCVIGFDSTTGIVQCSP